MRLDRAALLGTTALVVLAGPAHAQLAPNARPAGGVVSAGQATIGVSPTATTINQQSQRAALNWQSFNIGSAQTVQFNQPGAQSVTLNRVVGGDPSQIGGRILANGRVVLINQSGVVFTRGSQVDTAGLVVSAAGMSDQNFMAGRMVFDQAARPGAIVSNAGNITIRQAGLAALVAPQVANAGAITAKLGRVVLGGALTHTLDLYGDGLMALNVTGQVTQASLGGRKVTALVTNTGTILAPGGSVVLTAAAIDGLVSTLVTAGGTIAAASASSHTGRVLVQGIGGGVEVDGDVSATGATPGTTGGQVAVNATGAVMLAQGAVIDASGAAGGGAVALGTTMARVVRGPAAGSASTAKSVTVEAGSAVRANATVRGQGGRIALLSRDVTAQSGILSAQGGPQGGNGGWIEVSGGGQLDFGGRQLTGAAAGHPGTLYIDPADLIIGNSGGGTSTALITPAQFNAFTGDVIIKADGTLSVTADATLNTAATSLELRGDEGVLIGATLDAHAVPVTLYSATGNISDRDGDFQGTILAGSLQAFTRGGSVDLENPADSFSTVGSSSVNGSMATGLVATLNGNGFLQTRTPGTSDAYTLAGVASLDGSVDLTDSIPLQISSPVSASTQVFIDDVADSGTTVLAANITANTIDIEAAAINQSLGLISNRNSGESLTISSTGTVGGGISLGGTISSVSDGDGTGGTVSLSTITGSIVEAGGPAAFTGLIEADALRATASGASSSVALDNPDNAISALVGGSAGLSFSLVSNTQDESGGLSVQGLVNGGQTLSLTSSSIELAAFGEQLTATNRIVLQADSFDLSADVSAPGGEVDIDRLTPGTLVVGGSGSSFGTAALGNITSTILALGTTNGISPGVATGVDVETSLSSTVAGSAFYAFAHQDGGAGGLITIDAPVSYDTIGLEADSFAIAADVTASGGGLVGIALADPGTLTVGGATSVLDAASLGHITAGLLSLGSIDAATPDSAVSAILVEGPVSFTNSTVGLFAQGTIGESAAGVILADTLTGKSLGGSIALLSQNDIGDIAALSASTGISITVSGPQANDDFTDLSITGDVVTQSGTIAITAATGDIGLSGVLQAGTLAAASYTGAAALFAEDGSITEQATQIGTGFIRVGTLAAQAGGGDVTLDSARNRIATVAAAGTLTALSATGAISLVDGQGLSIIAPVSSGSGDVSITAIVGDIDIADTVQSGTLANGVYSGSVILDADAGNITESVTGQAAFGTILAGTLAAQADGAGAFNITLNNPAGNQVAVIGPVGDFSGLDASGDIAFINAQALSVAGFVTSNAGFISIETLTGDLSLGGTAQSGSLAGGVYTGTLKLVADAGDITETLPGDASATGTILAGTLAALAGSGTPAFDITLDNGNENQVGSIAAVSGLAGLSATGGVVFEDAQGLSIAGDVLSGSGPVQVTTLAGDLALGGTLRAGSAGTGTATLLAEAGNITETLPGAAAATGIIEAGVFAAEADTDAGTSEILLNSASGNAIGTIGAVGGLGGLSAGGMVVAINAQALVVTGDVTSTSGPVELTTLAGDLAVAGTVRSGTLAGGAYGGTALLLAQAGNITETLPGGTAATGRVLAATLAAQAGTFGTAYDVTLDDLAGNDFATVGTFAGLAGVSATGGVVLDDGRALSITGNVIGTGGSVAIATARGGLFIGGTIQSGVLAGAVYSGTLVLQSAAGISETLPSAAAPTGTLLAGILAADAAAGDVTLDNTAGNEIAAIAGLAGLTGVSASANITIVDGEALSVAGDVAAAGDVSLTAQTGDLVIGGTVQAGTLAVGAYTGTATLLAPTGNIVSASGTLLAFVLTGSASGSVVASTAASASAGNQVADLDEFGAGGSFVFVDGSDLAVIGALQAGGLISITTPGLQVVKGGSVTEAAGGLISLVADSFVFDGAVTSPGGIIALDLLHDGSITVDGAGSTLGDLANLSAGTIALGSLDGVTQSPGNTGSLWTAGSAGSVTLLAIDAALDLTGQAPALGLFSNGSVTSSGGITVGTLYGAAGGTLAASGSALITGANVIAVLGRFTVGTAEAGSGTAFELTDEASLTVAAPVIAASGVAGLASGGITLAVTGASASGFNGLAIGTSGITGSDVLLTVDGDIVQTGGSIAALAHPNGSLGSIVLVSGHGGVSAGGTLSAGTVLLSAAGDLTEAAGGSVQAGTLAVSAGGTILLDNPANLIGEIAPLASAQNGLTLTGLVAGGDVVVADGEALSLGDATAAAMTSGANVVFTLADGASLTQTGGTVVASGNLTVNGPLFDQTGGASVQTGGSVFVEGDLVQSASAIAAGGAVTVDGALTQNGSRLTAATNIGIGAPVVLSEVVLVAGAGISDGLSQVDSTIDAGGTFTLQTQGGFVQSANSTINGISGVFIQASGNSSQANSTITSGGAINLVIGGNLSLTTGTIASAGGTVTLSAGAALTSNAETITTPGAIEISAGTQDLASTAIDGGSDISLAATTGAINDIGSAIITSAGTIALSAASSILQSGGTIGDAASGGAQRILVDAPGTITIGGALAAANIVIGGAAAPAFVEWDDATIATSSSLAANGVKQALPSSSGGGLVATDPGVFVFANNFVQTGSTSVTPLGTSFATVQIALTPGGSIDFGNATPEGGGLQAPAAELLLLLGNGTATGNIDVAALGVAYSQGGGATLTGSVSGLTQFAAANAGVAFPLVDASYSLNGCAIGAADCGVPPPSPPLPFQIVPIYDPVAEVSTDLLDTNLLDEALSSSSGRNAGFIVVEPEEEAFVGAVRKRRESDDVILPDVGTVDY